jgi:DNA polymerase III delta prime subunit
MNTLISHFNQSNETNYNLPVESLMQVLNANIMNLASTDQNNISNVSTDLYSSIDAGKPKKQYTPLTYPIIFMEELYNSLIYINDLEFALLVLREINSCINFDEAEFITSASCDYYKKKRFIFTMEILETVYLAAVRSVLDKDPQNYSNIFGRVRKIGIRFAQDVVTFIPTDLKYASSKMIKRGDISRKDNYSQISEKEFVLLTSESKTAIGYVKEIDKNYTCKIFLNQDKFLESDKIIMTKLTNYTAFEKTLDGLKIFTTERCCSKNLHKLICGENYPEEINSLATREVFSKFNKGFSGIVNQHLNPSQQEALMCASKQSLTLIQGPPGTGKTTVGIEIIIEWLRQDSFNPILVCADSNIAVDILHRELSKAGVNALRMGVKEEIIFDKANKFSQYRRLVKHTNVVCCTCVGSLCEYLGEEKFTRILIDEATQATELSTIIPLVKSAEQLVLIGDHKQLPPTIISFNAEKEGLSISLFEKLINKGIKPVMLNTQYRMHPSISFFPSQNFYNSLLLNGIGDKHRPPILGFPWPNPNIRVSFVNVTGDEEMEGSSYFNRLEINMVLDILIKIFNYNTVNIQDVGIVTPYDSQKRKFRREVGNMINTYPQLFLVNNPNTICSVDTVDGFQGMDKDLIIFSSVRSNPKGSIGFLKDPRRLNVMLTRAKRGLIVVGNYNCLIADPNWREWLQWVDYCGSTYK